MPPRLFTLVDVGVCSADHVGSPAVWDGAALREFYCTFATPQAIGPSSVPGLLCPSTRNDLDGVALALGPADESGVVHARIGPGLGGPVGVRS